MGWKIDNVYLQTHVQEGQVIGVGLVLHRGDQGLHKESPEISVVEVDTLHQIVMQGGSDAELDSAATQIWGLWWGDWIRSRGQIPSARVALRHFQR